MAIEPIWHQPGDHVVLREVLDRRAWSGRPVTVVRDDPDLVALYTAPGMRWKRPANIDGVPLRLPDQVWNLIEDVWTGGDMLRLAKPGDPFSVLLFWDTGGQSWSWYINIEAPLRRSRIGFDYLDHTLDIVVAPVRSWRWKDEDELAEAVRLGGYSQQQADQIRGDGERALRVLEANGSPYCDGWEHWRSDPSWTIPFLPAGWDSIDLP